MKNKIHADFIKEKRQVDTYYKHPVKDELKDRKTYLRVREEKDGKCVAMHYRNNNRDWVELESSYSILIYFLNKIKVIKIY